MKKRGLFVCVLVVCLSVPLSVFGAGSKEADAAKPVTLNLLMEDVPDTQIIKDMLPEFEAKTGIKVNFEIVQYTDMHTKLITQFLAPTSTYDVIEVDNYWAGEFPAAGWLEPLDEYVKKDNFDMSVYVPAMMEMVGYYKEKLYMIPMYNYTMALMYRNDVFTDKALHDKYRKQFGKDFAPPVSLDEYVEQCISYKQIPICTDLRCKAARAIPLRWSGATTSLALVGASMMPIGKLRSTVPLP